MESGIAALPTASRHVLNFLLSLKWPALMRVSKMTVYRLVHNGELPAVRVGRSFRVHAKAVHDMLESSYFDAG